MQVEQTQTFPNEACHGIEKAPAASETRVDKDLSKPEQLSADGDKAYRVIMDFLSRKEFTYAGGCKAFYAPQEFAATMHESVAHDAVLVVVHEGAALAPAFNWDYQQYALMEELRKDLEQAGLWIEQQTSCFSAVFMNLPTTKM